MIGMQYSWKVSAKGFIIVRQAGDSAKFHEMCLWQRERDEAVCLFPEQSDNVSMVGYCGNGFKYYMDTSGTISYACVHSQTDTKPP